MIRKSLAIMFFVGSFVFSGNMQAASLEVDQHVVQEVAAQVQQVIQGLSEKDRQALVQFVKENEDVLEHCIAHIDLNLENLEWWGWLIVGGTGVCGCLVISAMIFLYGVKKYCNYRNRVHNNETV